MPFGREPTFSPLPSAIAPVDDTLWHALHVSELAFAPFGLSGLKIVVFHSSKERSMCTPAGVMMSWHEPHIDDLFAAPPMRFLSLSESWGGGEGGGGGRAAGGR